ncbi:hypothetical protein P4O66_014160, partial [Electrophorus voltai]
MTLRMNGATSECHVALEEGAHSCHLLHSFLDSLANTDLQWCHTVRDLTETHSQKQLDLVREIKAAEQALLECKEYEFPHTLDLMLSKVELEEFRTQQEQEKAVNQHLVVDSDLHVQQELDIQQALLLLQLCLHLLPHVRHLLFFLREPLVYQCPLALQCVLQLLGLHHTALSQRKTHPDDSVPF